MDSSNNRDPYWLEQLASPIWDEVLRREIEDVVDISASMNPILAHPTTPNAGSTANIHLRNDGLSLSFVVPQEFASTEALLFGAGDSVEEQIDFVIQVGNDHHAHLPMASFAGSTYYSTWYLTLRRPSTSGAVTTVDAVDLEPNVSQTPVADQGRNLLLRGSEKSLISAPPGAQDRIPKATTRGRQLTYLGISALAAALLVGVVLERRRHDAPSATNIGTATPVPSVGNNLNARKPDPAPGRVGLENPGSAIDSLNSAPERISVSAILQFIDRGATIPDLLKRAQSDDPFACGLYFALLDQGAVGKSMQTIALGLTTQHRRAALPDTTHSEVVDELDKLMLEVRPHCHSASN